MNTKLLARALCLTLVVTSLHVAAQHGHAASPAQGPTPSIESPDKRYEAVLVGTPKSGFDAHYQIREKATARVLFSEHDRWQNSPSNVKAGAFSPDSTKFASLYHYGNEPHTWIMVFKASTGELISKISYTEFRSVIPTDVFGSTSATTIVSGNDQYEAVLVGEPKSGKDAHYQIRKRDAQRTPIFTEHDPFKKGPSNVKVGVFSPDSSKFASIYHYADGGPHTWIMVFNVSNGTLFSQNKYDNYKYEVPDAAFTTPNLQPPNGPQNPITSPNGRFKAELVGIAKSGQSAHYRITDTKTGHSYIEQPRDETASPSDVKAGMFDADSARFASFYHYRTKGPVVQVAPHTLIVVTLVETGWVDFHWECPGYEITLCNGFPTGQFRPIGQTSQQPSQPDPLPNLTIVNFAESKAIVHANEKFDFQVSIGNVGAAAAGSHKIRFWLDPKPAGDTVADLNALGKHGDETGEVLAATSGRLVSHSYTLSKGKHTLWVCVDADNQVKESNENDNCSGIRDLDVWDALSVQTLRLARPANTLSNNQELRYWDKVTSSNGRYSLVFQDDAQLVLYRNSDHVALWASNTVGSGGYRVRMQEDGNLVMYKPDGTPVWASGTNQGRDAYLIVQDDGNTVIYRNKTPLWSTATNRTPAPKQTQTTNTLSNNQELRYWDKVTSSNGRYSLVFQDDAQLVLYRNSDHVALWASNTVGSGGYRVRMQEDGNLVMYKPDGTSVWASNTNQGRGAYLIVQDDGNTVIYRNKTPLWASNTRQ